MVNTNEASAMMPSWVNRKPPRLITCSQMTTAA